MTIMISKKITDDIVVNETKHTTTMSFDFFLLNM